ncbi:MAG: flavin reductase family protein [Deltaproteobacteria bacterium]|nr:flavin reductase family protein [Deltaproteobacteria bacterium]
MTSPNPDWKPGQKIEAPGGDLISFSPAEKDVASIYKFLIGSVVPRPIAFVSTISKDGVSNLAPFSFFNALSSNPPCVMISISARPGGEYKDTLRNIEETKEFVVNSANRWLLEPLVHCAAEYPYGVSEFEKAGLTAIASEKVKPQRVKESAVQLECELYQTVKIGDGSPGSSTLVIGKIVMFHVLDRIYQDGKINLEELKPIARLGGVNYCSVGEIFGIPIPKV